MKLVKSDNVFKKDPYFVWPIGEEEALSKSIDFFDKDGYELTEIEKYYATMHGVDLSEKHNKHTAAHYWWYKDEMKSESDLVLDHSMIITRYSFAEEAKRELQRLKVKRPVLLKLLSIKTKYGIDFSLDYIGEDEVFEIFHIEQDFFDWQEAMDVKGKAEELIESTDWLDGAKQVLKKKDEWFNLNSDDQSDWKAKYFGWHRAFDNRKVFINIANGAKNVQ